MTYVSCCLDFSHEYYGAFSTLLLFLQHFYTGNNQDRRNSAQKLRDHWVYCIQIHYTYKYSRFKNHYF